MITTAEDSGKDHLSTVQTENYWQREVPGTVKDTNNWQATRSGASVGFQRPSLILSIWTTDSLCTPGWPLTPGSHAFTAGMLGLQSPCPSTNLSLNLYVALEQILSFLSLGQTLLKLTSQEGSTIVFFYVQTSRTRQNHLGKIVPFNLIFYCLSLFLICKAIA